MGLARPADALQMSPTFLRLRGLKYRGCFGAGREQSVILSHAEDRATSRSSEQVVSLCSSVLERMSAGKFVGYDSARCSLVSKSLDWTLDWVHLGRWAWHTNEYSSALAGISCSWTSGLTAASKLDRCQEEKMKDGWTAELYSPIELSINSERLPW